MAACRGPFSRSIILLSVKQKTLTYRDLISVLFRCLFIQGVWNYESMIGIGFCFCAIPVAKRLYKDPDKREQFLRRHLYFFNAHPYFASYALGAIAKEEEKSVRENIDQSEHIQLFKERLTGPLGLMGDRLFWDSIKPLAAALGVLVALVAGYVGALVYLVFYNIPHLFVRIQGLWLGYKHGFQVVNYFSFKKLNRSIGWIKAASLCVVGLLVIAASHWSLAQGDAVVLAFLLSVIASFILFRNKFSVNLIILVIIGVGVLIGWLFYWI